MLLVLAGLKRMVSANWMSIVVFQIVLLIISPHYRVGKCCRLIVVPRSGLWSISSLVRRAISHHFSWKHGSREIHRKRLTLRRAQLRWHQEKLWPRAQTKQRHSDRQLWQFFGQFFITRIPHHNSAIYTGRRKGFNAQAIAPTRIDFQGSNTVLMLGRQHIWWICRTLGSRRSITSTSHSISALEHGQCRRNIPTSAFAATSFQLSSSSFFLRGLIGELEPVEPSISFICNPFRKILLA